MPIITNFGDSNTTGNTTLQQNLIVQGAFSQFYGNILASSSTVGIGNVTVPFSNIFATNANITSVNTTTLVATTMQAANVTASNALTTTNVFVTRSNVSGVQNVFSFVVTSNVGIGMNPSANALSVQGNAYVSNTVTAQNVFTVTANIVQTCNTYVLNASNIGIGTSPFGNALSVQGNVYVSNSIVTPNITSLNYINATTTNTTSLIITSSFNIGGAAGANLTVTGNIWVSNALTATNVFTTNINATSINTTSANITTLNTVSLNFSTLNVTTLNTVSIYGQSGSVGINTSTNLGATLQVQGNVYASNALTGTNLIVSGTIYYNEDLFKRGPYLTPSAANASTIQAWISATCNAASQPSKSWWATSPDPVYGNISSGPNGSSAFAGSILLPDGRVLFVPCNSSNVGFFTPATGVYSNVSVPGITAATNKFRGGVLVPNGNVVFIPHNTSNVGLYNPVANIYSNIQVGAAAAGSGLRFSGGVLSPTGNVVMIPRDSANIGIFNPITLAMTNVGPIAGQGLRLFGDGTLLPNGNVVMSPYAFAGGAGPANIGMYNTASFSTTAYINVGQLVATGCTSYETTVLTPNGNVLFFPSTGSSNIVVYNPTYVSNPLPSGGMSNIQMGSALSFLGGTLLPSGTIVTCPHNTDYVGAVDPITLTFSTSSYVAQNGGGKFAGCTLIPDGRVVFCPYAYTNVGIINTMVPAPREFCMSPYFNKF
jgi:hypothetical protein